jgi:hypothetical protein
MRKFLGSAVVVLVAFTIASGDEYRAIIKKIDDGKVTFAKRIDKTTTGDDMTLPLANDAKLVKGVFDKDSKTFKAGDALEKAAVKDIMTKAADKGAQAFIVTDKDNKSVTEIRFITGGKGGGGGK